MRWRRFAWLVGAFGIAVVVLLLLSVVPVPRTFTKSYANVPGPGPSVDCNVVGFPRGAMVNIHWTAVPPTPLITVWSCTPGSNTSWHYTGEDSARFVSNGGVYEFSASCTDQTPSCVWLNITGTYTSPLLVWP
jgi:hypothetical protein